MGSLHQISLSSSSGYLPGTTLTLISTKAIYQHIATQCILHISSIRFSSRLKHAISPRRRHTFTFDAARWSGSCGPVFSRPVDRGRRVRGGIHLLENISWQGKPAHSAMAANTSQYKPVYLCPSGLKRLSLSPTSHYCISMLLR